MIKVKINGLQELQNKLKKLEKNIENYKVQQISLSELLNDSFLSKYTNFKKLGDLGKGISLNLSKLESFKEKEKKELDTYIKSNSKFESWQKMIDKAIAEVASKQIFN